MSFADAAPRRRALRARAVTPSRLLVYGIVGNVAGAAAAFAAVFGYLALAGELERSGTARMLISSGVFAALTAAIGFAYLLVVVPVMLFALRRGRRAFLAAAGILSLLPAAVLFGNRYFHVVALAHGLAGGGVAAALVLRRGRDLWRSPRRLMSKPDR
jgi:hypothetical protein